MDPNSHTNIEEGKWYKWKEPSFSTLIPLHGMLLPKLELHLSIFHLEYEQSWQTEGLQSSLSLQFSVPAAGCAQTDTDSSCLYTDKVRSESLNMLKVISTKTLRSLKFILASMMMK